MDWFSNPPSWMLYLSLVIASWRLAYLFVHEGGPWGLIEAMREHMGIVHGDDGAAQSWPSHPPATLFTCTLCLSFWTTLLLYGILWVVPDVVMFLAAWGGASLLELVRRR